MEKEFKLIIKKGVTKKDPIVVITSHPVGEPSGCEERIERKLSLRGAEFTELSLPRVKRGGGNPPSPYVDCHARSSLAMTATVSKLFAMTEGTDSCSPGRAIAYV